MGKFCSLTLILIVALAAIKAQETGPNYVSEPYGRIPAARGIALDDAGDLLVVADTAGGTITSLFELNGTINSTPILNNRDLALTHGIALRNGFLYASSETTVYRWPYTPGQRDMVDFTQEEIVVQDIPENRWHITRTTKFDSTGILYVSIGARGNVDEDSTSARIRRFNISSIPVSWEDGEIFADGTRNAVGLGFDLDGVLWAVDNGADELVRDDLGGDIHNTNPADEMIKFDKEPGTYYGYPFCWSVDELEGHQKGKQMAWPDTMNDGVHSDEWCQNLTNTHPPTLPLPAHWAALGITFYDGLACNTSEGAFPCNMTWDAFVAFHGSWNREPAEGYRVVRIPIDKENGLPTGEMEDVLYEPEPATCGRCFRPVDLLFDRNGHLLISADLGMYRVKYMN